MTNSELTPEELQSEEWRQNNSAGLLTTNLVTPSGNYQFCLAFTIPR